MIGKKITILTDPLPWGWDLLPEGARRIARKIINLLRPKRKYFNHPIYRGHFAVTRSLVEGLQKINANFNYNPFYPRQLADTVVVLAGVRTLRQAIRLKRKGKIKKLYAGPNIVNFSTDYNSMVGSPEIDCYVVNSKWTYDLYVEDCPTLRGRCYIWPAGVDTEYWRPDPAIRRTRVLIYKKTSAVPVAPYVEYLHRLGWSVHLIEYGTFSHNQYREMLQGSCLMLGFVTAESQGIAWAEAWSSDVPTMIWKNTTSAFQGRRFDCSTAPYLCSENGLFFDDLEDFKIKFGYWEKHRDQFKPRDWTLCNMSDEVCASLLYKKSTDC